MGLDLSRSGIESFTTRKGNRHDADIFSYVLDPEYRQIRKKPLTRLPIQTTQARGLTSLLQLQDKDSIKNQRNWNQP